MQCRYVGEAEDGYDSVEWIAQQKWSNGKVLTDGCAFVCRRIFASASEELVAPRSQAFVPHARADEHGAAAAAAPHQHFQLPGRLLERAHFWRAARR